MTRISKILSMLVLLGAVTGCNSNSKPDADPSTVSENQPASSENAASQAGPTENAQAATGSSMNGDNSSRGTAPAKLNFPDGEAGVRAMLAEFLKPGADTLALTLALKPISTDYAAVFATEAFAAQANTHYENLWKRLAGNPIRANEGQTEILLVSATTEDLKAWTGNAPEFPVGFKEATAYLKPKLVVYRWKFVKPGETSGMAFDGLVYVNGHWRIFPKPWQI